MNFNEIGDTNQRGLDNVGHSLSGHNVRLYGLSAMLSLLFSLAVSEKDTLVSFKIAYTANIPRPFVVSKREGKYIGERTREQQ